MLQALRISFAFGAVLALVTAAPAATITGDYLEARTCDVYTGSCFANAEIGLTGDQGIIAWKVAEGTWNGVDLSGLAVVAAIKARDTMGDEFTNPYPSRSVLIVDERATREQTAALIDFAKAAGGKLLENVARIEFAPIELAVGCCDKRACAKLVAGKMVKLETRCPNEGDHVCGNEEVYYQPLTKVIDFIPAVTVQHRFNGKGLGGTWSSPDKRSAFVASFVR